jgi:hypothetical protein
MLTYFWLLSTRGNWASNPRSAKAERRSTGHKALTRHHEWPEILTIFRRFPLANLRPSATLSCLVALFAFSTCSAPAYSQAPPTASLSSPAALDFNGNPANAGHASGDSASLSDSSTAGADSPENPTDPELELPAAPVAGGGAGNPKREAVPWDAEWHQQPFSRIGIGADVSPLGIGIKGAIVLNEYLDARVDMNFFGYTSGRFEIDGVNVNGNLHLLSDAAKVDLYPRNSIWRVSAGIMMYNGNRLSAAASIVTGTSFKLNGTTYYSSSTDPFTGSGVLALDTVKPAPLVSFGFGRFIPRSNRHWSFPTEFGIIYTGAPSLTVATAGTVCTDAALTNCSDVNDPASPVGAAFNSNLQAQLTKWRNGLDKVQLYPIFSYSVVYSFNIR